MIAQSLLFSHLALDFNHSINFDIFYLSQFKIHPLNSLLMLLSSNIYLEIFVDVNLKRFTKYGHFKMAIFQAVNNLDIFYFNQFFKHVVEIHSYCLTQVQLFHEFLKTFNV